MAVGKNKGLVTEPIPLHRILREALRHYTEFEQYVADSGRHVIDHGYWIYNEDGTKKQKVTLSISFWDLKKGLTEDGILSKRKRQAVMLNVIKDMKQRDVADIMGITTVSVGQYVEQAVTQLAEAYFSKEEFDQVKDKSSEDTEKPMGR